MDCVIDPAPASGVPSPDLSAAPGDWFSHKFVNVGTRERSRRFTGEMSPICPACRKPMHENNRLFACEPCRQIILFFDVSENSPYLSQRTGRDDQQRFDSDAK